MKFPLEAIPVLVWLAFALVTHGLAPPRSPSSPRTLSARRRLSDPTPELTDVDRTAETMSLVTKAVTHAAPRVVAGLRERGWAVVDGFLRYPALTSAMRREAESFFEKGDMVLGQSTRFDPITQSVVTYNKHNVYSMQLMGGDAYYRGPRLHEYCVAMVKTIVPLLSDAFPEANLSPTMVSNKLAVCIGEGSAYDKHYDNSGLSDTRKVTALYYLNFNWKPEHGGCFRIFNPGSDEVTDIEPLADRLLVFWSDRLVHSVEPSFAPDGKDDFRYALTLWMTSKSPSDIVRDDAEIEKHFGALAR